MTSVPIPYLFVIQNLNLGISFLQARLKPPIACQNMRRTRHWVTRCFPWMFCPVGNRMVDDFGSNLVWTDRSCQQFLRCGSSRLHNVPCHFTWEFLHTPVVGRKRSWLFSSNILPPLAIITRQIHLEKYDMQSFQTCSVPSSDQNHDSLWHPAMATSQLE